MGQDDADVSLVMVGFNEAKIQVGPRSLIFERGFIFDENESQEQQIKGNVSIKFLVSPGKE